MYPKMKNSFLLVFILNGLLYINNLSAQDSTSTLQLIDNTSPSLIAQDKDITISELKLLHAGDDLVYNAIGANGKATISINGDDQEIIFKDGYAGTGWEVDESGGLKYLSFLTADGAKQQALYHVSKTDGLHRIREIPLWLSIIPPLLAIFLALIFKEVNVSLFAGIWAGAFIAGGLRLDGIYYFFKSFFNVLEKYIISALSDAGHLSVILFSLLIGGMVAIISKNGGMAGVVKALSKYARSPVSSQFITWLLGVAIFFDDYANTLIVGNTMRSVTDKFKISREKLAYIVDSTAAPVAAVAFITTWIGAELGYIDDGLKLLELDTGMTPYAVFLASLKYSFYPFLTLIFILFVIFMKRDFGGMYKAEIRARSTGQVSPANTESEDEPDMEDLSPVKNAPLKWYNAVLPVMTVIGMTIFGLIDTGMQSVFGSLSELNADVSNNYGDIWTNMQMLENTNAGFFSKLGTLIGSADSYVALLWASLSGLIVAIALTVGSRIMNLFDTMHWMVTGIKTMLPAIIILTLAWALAITTKELHTADFLSSALQDTINPYVFPMIIFVLAAFTAFSTGSSWSTMAILYPIAIPTSYAISQANGLSPEITMELMLNVIATVLGASVLGDHCSPISDTTILSSLATDCNHLDHVKTQMPYALVVGTVSIICVGLSTFLGGGALISIILGLVSIGFFYFFLKTVGKPVPE